MYINMYVRVCVCIYTLSLLLCFFFFFSQTGRKSALTKGNRNKKKWGFKVSAFEPREYQNQKCGVSIVYHNYQIEKKN